MVVGGSFLFRGAFSPKEAPTHFRVIATLSYNMEDS